MPFDWSINIFIQCREAFIYSQGEFEVEGRLSEAVEQWREGDSEMDASAGQKQRNTWWIEILFC